MSTDRPPTPVDLSTTYLGMRLRSPIVASPSPVTGSPPMWERLERAGVGAIVLPSLFEEQIEREEAAFEALFSDAANAEGTWHAPAPHGFDAGPARHLALVEQARAAVTVPVIASINGVSPGGWVQYARHLVDAGAEAIELNLYDVVADPHLSALDVERRYVELVEEVRAEVTVPLAVKIGASFTALANLALAFQRAGADGLVLFNRVYQPDIDLDGLRVVPRHVLSSPADPPPSLHWIAILRGLDDFHGSLAGTTGVHSGADALKLLLAGGDVAMTASALLRHGPTVVSAMIDWIQAWMIERGYSSIDQLRGSMSHRNVPDPSLYERLNYYQSLHSWVRGPAV